MEDTENRKPVNGDSADIERRRKITSQRLRELRERKGISRSDLARQIGVSESGIGFWETGVRYPRPAVIKKYANYFNVSEQFLLGLSDDPLPEEYKKLEQEVPVEMRRLSRLMRKYTPDEIMKWAEITKALFEGLDEKRDHQKKSDDS